MSCAQLCPTCAKRLVVALGGNAISAPGKIGDIDEQFAQVAKRPRCSAMRSSAATTWSSRTATARRSATSCAASRSPRSELYTIPLEVCVADTQAGMGYMIAQCLSNVMNRRNLTCDVTTVVTTVLVDRDDPAFQEADQSDRPGAHAGASRVASHQRRLESPRRRRRPLPSRGAFAASRARSSRCPRSSSLSTPAQIVVCCGGGGIPVCVDSNRASSAASAAVIDKDRTTGLLARHLEAPTLVILTAVEFACINYGKPNEAAAQPDSPPTKPKPT